MRTTLLLIRHGETVWNRDRRIQGQKDAPLSEEGERQSRRLGRRLAGLKFDAVYSSDSERCLRTASLALARREPVLNPAFRERHYGDWEGLRWEDIDRRWPGALRAFDEDPAGFSPPGGETWNQLQRRVFEEVEKLVSRHPGQTVLIFSHGGPCRAAVFAALDVPPKLWRHWVIGNTSIQEILWDGDLPRRGRSPWKVLRMNDTAHLEENPAAVDERAV